jgi:hypothetical protein
VKSAGHPKLEKKGEASLELKLEDLPPANDGENLPPREIFHFPQTLVQDPALQNAGSKDNMPELSAQGFHFG